MLVVIDGDVLRYELGAVAIEKTEVFGIVAERPWPDCDVDELVDQRIQSIIERCGANEYEVYLTGPGNFRFDIATIKPYKGNRASIQKPYHWGTVSRRLLSKWGARVVEGIEADDALALRATEATRAGIDCVIASRDKDLRQVPCKHYSWACGENQPEIPVYDVDELGSIEAVAHHAPSGTYYTLKGMGLKFFYGQILVGDSTDNIPGCPRVGPVKALEILQHCENEEQMFERVAREYLKRYGDGWKSALEENARLLYLIREKGWLEATEEDGVTKYKVIKMWESPYDLSEYDKSATL